jgi:hypothetical protein
MLRLPFCFPLLRAQTLKRLDDAREENLGHETRETLRARKPRNKTRASCFRGFR